MDVVPPEFDEATKERIYRQEWLEHFHYIGLETAKRDYPAQYQALFPHGHHTRPQPSARPPLSSAPAEAVTPPAKRVEGEEGRASVAASHSSSGSSAEPNAPANASRRGDSERDSRKDVRSDRERPPYASRRPDRPSSFTRTHDDRDDDRHRSFQSHHRSHPRSSRDDAPHSSYSSGSRRRQRSDERDDRRSARDDRYDRRSSRDDREDRRSSRYDRDDRRSTRDDRDDRDDRRYRREGGSSSSRSHAYDDRREDALRRRESNYRR
uniref:Putative splicing factor ptsr1 interacting protein n=1 Tax=Angomonas deanei TaxID=59799 RepID=C6K3N1_9TRYP|nr:putative splicing factor ptsr1 interacting protein [Angomonas deanei]